MKQESPASISELARTALCSRGTIHNLVAAGKMKPTMAHARALRRSFLLNVAAKLSRSYTWNEREAALQAAATKQLMELAGESE